MKNGEFCSGSSGQMQVELKSRRRQRRNFFFQIQSMSSCELFADTTCSHIKINRRTSQITSWKLTEYVFCTIFILDLLQTTTLTRSQPESSNIFTRVKVRVNQHFPSRFLGPESSKYTRFIGVGLAPPRGKSDHHQGQVQHPLTKFTLSMT